MLQHAAITDAARVGQQLRPGVGMRGEKAVNQALDPFWIRAVPMPKAMQRAFSAGKRFEIENCGHHMQGCAMKGVAVFQAGAAVHRHDVPPHVADGVEGRTAGLVTVRQMGEQRGRNSLRNSDSHACTQRNRAASGTEGLSRQRMCSPSPGLIT